MNISSDLLSILVRLLTAVLGTFGFSILFYIRPRRLPLAALSGLLTCGMYILMNRLLGGEFLPNLAAAFLGAVFSELIARRTKTPVSVYLTPCMIPLVPGYALYRTMSCLVRSDYLGFAENTMTTSSAALGIAGGIAAASVLTLLIRSSVEKRAAKRKPDASAGKDDAPRP